MVGAPPVAATPPVAVARRVRLSAIRAASAFVGTGAAAASRETHTSCSGAGLPAVRWAQPGSLACDGADWRTAGPAIAGTDDPTTVKAATPAMIINFTCT